MFCKNCGNKLGEHDLFCENCGHQVDYIQADMEKDIMPKPQSMSEKTKAALILVAFIAVALIVGLLYYFYFSPYANNNNTETSAVVVGSIEDAPEELSSEVKTTTIMETPAETTIETGDYYRVSVGYNNRLSFRAEPNEDSAKLNRIDDGTKLLITEISGNWGKTSYGGVSGWVCLQKDGDIYCIRE